MMDIINSFLAMDLFTQTILVLAIITGFYMAWNIGANDVANAMGTVVGSGSITIKQAIIVAGIFEFCGAFFVGGNVADTISKGIVSPVVVQNANLFIMGMLAALIASSIWLNIATYFGWPVSTTHAIVGGVAGFGILIGGFGAVNWNKMGDIVASWVISPVMGALIAFIIFKVIERNILEKRNPVRSAKRVVPLIVAAASFVMAFSLLYKGLKNLKFEINFIEAAGISIVIAALLGILTYVLMKRLDHRGDDKEQKYEIVEGVFMKLQLVTACYISFAHGANDVANAVGPVAGIYSALVNSGGEMAEKVTVPSWILVMGAIGIVIGIATYGYKVIGTIGEKITEITATRGFSAEMGTATTVLIASRMGLPISTTHTLVGAVIGVALGRGVAVLNLKMIKSIVASWFITIPVTIVLTILILKIMMFFV